MRQLFRQEAIDAQREKLFGEVSQARPIPMWIFTVTALVFAAALVSFSIWGEYARRETVSGYLALDSGAARIQAPEAGTVAELFVKEGDEVQAGAPLARMSFERNTKTGGNASIAVERELNQRLATIDREKEQTRTLGEQQIEQLRKRIDDLQKELAQADVEIRLQTQRIVSAEQLAARYRDLANDKFVSDIVAQQKTDDVLDQRMKLQSLKRAQSKIESDLRAARSEVPSVGTRTSADLEKLNREQSELQQNLVQEEARREMVLRAPITGTVTNIAITRGQSLSDDALLATILPKGSGLHAQLLVPSRAIGFVRPGQRVVLRYEAFPFQRFGQYGGSIVSVSRTVWAPGETLGPITAKEPVYRVEVALDEQTVRANGSSFGLLPGMLLGADILLEKRTVLEWLFEPIMGLKERLQ